MFKIGEFAQMSRVSVRTLHHYEELGLLLPFEVDKATGYRYYSTQQLFRLNKILTLKDLGLSLEQIGLWLNADLATEQLKEMLLLKQTEFGQQLLQTQLTLNRLAIWLHQLEGGSDMTTIDDYEFELKKVEPMLVASLSQTVSAYSNLSVPFNVLRTYLAQFSFTRRHPSLILWHFKDTNNEEEQGFQVELAEQLDELIPENEQIKVYSLPQVESAASIIHRGSFDQAYQAYQALGSWIERQGYTTCGPTRQIHHEFNPKHDPGTYLTEFQLPVEKLSITTTPNERTA